MLLKGLGRHFRHQIFFGIGLLLEIPSPNSCAHHAGLQEP
jgi:hypothetical protein